MIRMLEFPAEMVYRNDTSKLEHLLSDLEGQSPEDVRRVQGTFMLAFPAFESAEEPTLVPEVKRFLSTVHSRIQHLFYYLAPEKISNNLQMFLEVHSSEDHIHIENGQVTIDYDPSVMLLLVDRLTATAEFAMRMADDAMQIISQIVEPFEPDMRRDVIHQVSQRISKP